MARRADGAATAGADAGGRSCVASGAARHFRIAKSAGRGDVARTSVEALAEDAVVGELVRMLGSDGSDAGARRHAEELLAAA